MLTVTNPFADSVPVPLVTPPRVAFCTDTFVEPNGVATVSRAFLDFARQHQLPVLLIRPGSTHQVSTQGLVTIVDVPKSSLCLPLDMGLRFDLLIHRQAPFVREQMMAFEPDLVHITGPGDIGMICARISHTLRTPKPPLVAAWHTNVHQYARMRFDPFLRWLPRKAANRIGMGIEKSALSLAARFYKTARLSFAPNADILADLTSRTGRPGRVMPHGVDSRLFSPATEARRESGTVTLGYAGRLTAEKNVRFLAEVAAGLTTEQRNRCRFLIVGDGVERHWLERHMPANTTFTGILRGQDLADAYRQMDVFLFPSLSDTFGLVLLEAMAAGLPVVSFRTCGPNSVVNDGVNGYAAPSGLEFARRVGGLVDNAGQRAQMAVAAREHALTQSWDAVFLSVYETYKELLDLVAGRPVPSREQPATVGVH